MSPNQSDQGTWIHQDAYIHLASLEAGKSIEYISKNKSNGLYVMNIEGTFSTLSNQLNDRDALSILDVEKLIFNAQSNSKFLVLEVPMTF